MLKVCETFFSIQGESSFAGYPCAFVRLAGCNLRCSYCDTRYAWEGGDDMPVAQVADLVCSHGSTLVEITGGEPLIQEDTPALVQALLDRNRTVLVETNGTRDLSPIPDGAIRIVDIKCPGSGETGRMDWDNIGRLRSGDEVKFVLCDEPDYAWAKDTILRHGLDGAVKLHFSPAAGRLDPARLAGWMLRDALNVRLQVQIHRILWPGSERGR
jgi:7-carboxy-7-deazaguanine synthase